MRANSIAPISDAPDESDDDERVPVFDASDIDADDDDALEARAIDGVVSILVVVVAVAVVVVVVIIDDDDDDR